MGIWDARLEVESSAEVEIRTTIPPSGFLVQGTTEELDKLEFNSVVIAVHPANRITRSPIANSCRRRLDYGRDSRMEDDNSSDIWSQDLDLVLYRCQASGLLTSGVQKMVDFGVKLISDLAAMIEDPAVAYVAPLPVLELKNDNARSHMGIDSVESSSSQT